MGAIQEARTDRGAIGTSDDRMQVRVLESLAEVDAEEWDRLAGADDPFVEHRFLRCLEVSGSVGERSGWTPSHITVWDEERLVGALPMYTKSHSFGEYIFDWAWADASHRIGAPYYPKLVSMIPVTPATGRRLLIDSARDRRAVAMRLIEGTFELADRESASSIHLLFVSEEEREVLSADERLRPRLSHQFHWHNRGWSTFDDFLSDFRASMRKQVRKERRRVCESGLTILTKEGSNLTTEDWDVLPHLYNDTCARKGSPPYLTPAFFRTLREMAADRLVCVFAYDGDRPVAATINFEKGPNLYGRYWGCVQDYEMLHFELCYYRLIDRAIAKGHQRFEAGAQGLHKLRRGLMPSRVHSMHWIRHPLLASAVDDFLPREAGAVERELVELADHGPFRRSEPGDDSRGV